MNSIVSGFFFLANGEQTFSFSNICNEKKKNELEANKIKNFIEKYVEGKILGPVNSPIFRLKRKYRMRLLIRSKKTLHTQKSISKAISKYTFPSGIKLTVDVDPINFN